jgi:hypothetical protein
LEKKKMSIVALTPILNVSGIRASVAWFEKLGWRCGFLYNDGGDEPTFGSVRTDKAEIFLCLNGQGARGGTEPQPASGDDSGCVWMSWWVESPAEVDALHQLALSQGMVVTRAPVDEPWCVREFHLRHPDGHTFRISAGLEDED